ncbi:MAG: YceI family protein [Cyclobacteriaceae bacterium]|nr:YceI family protein [Cyclobacteriaceae bacterium]
MKPTRKIIGRTVTMAVSLMLLSMLSLAQSYSLSGSPVITIAGTSTMHDWTMTSNEATCQATFETDASGNPTKISSLVINIQAESLKSGKGAMDKNAYNALKTDKNKLITFQISAAQINGKTVSSNGNLTIAGTSKPTEVSATFEVLGDKSVQFKGSKKMKMSDYKVEPPTFMFGSIKTGDEITITYELKLSPK